MKLPRPRDKNLFEGGDDAGNQNSKITAAAANATAIIDVPHVSQKPGFLPMTQRIFSERNSMFSMILLFFLRSVHKVRPYEPNSN